MTLLLVDRGGTGRCFPIDVVDMEVPEETALVSWLCGGVSPFGDSLASHQALAVETLRRSISLGGGPVRLQLEPIDAACVRICIEYQLDRLSADICPLPEFNRMVFREFQVTIETALLAFVGLEGVRCGMLVDSFSAMDRRSQLRFMLMVARRLHAAPFENFSRLEDGVPFRPGHESWLHFAAGGGGVCAEKTAALAFLCDILDVPYRHVLASGSPLTVAYEDALEAYCQAEGPTPEWVPHHLLQIQIKDRWYCVDPTGGSLPLRFFDERDWAGFERGGMRLRLAYRSEKLYPRAVPMRTGCAILDLSGFAAPNLIGDFVLRQQLGLCLQQDSYVYVAPDWGGARSKILQQWAGGRATKVGAPPPLIVRDDDLDRLPHGELRNRIAGVIPQLYKHLCGPAYTGAMAIVYQPLNHFWSREQISKSVCEIVETIPKSTFSAFSTSSPSDMVLS